MPTRKSGALRPWWLPLAFPILDSFPHNMFTLPQAKEKVQVLAALTASSRTAEKLKMLETLAGRVAQVDASVHAVLEQGSHAFHG